MNVRWNAGLTLLRRARSVGLIVLYLVPRSADHAGLAGATLAFPALAGLIYLTGNEDRCGSERPAHGPQK